MKTLTALLGLCAALFLSGATYASSTLGIYVLVEKAELGPIASGMPQWIKIKGAFMNEVTPTGWRLKDFGPMRGCVYFKLPNDAKQAQKAVGEWKDFVRIQGKNKESVVAFGGTAYGVKNAIDNDFVYRVGNLLGKEFDCKLENAVAYPVNIGMNLVRDNNRSNSYIYYLLGAIDVDVARNLPAAKP